MTEPTINIEGAMKYMECLKKEKENRLIEEKNIITLSFYREDIEDELGFNFTDNRWDEFKDEFGTTWNENNCYIEDIKQSNHIDPKYFHYYDRPDKGYHFEDGVFDVSPNEYWTDDNCEEKFEKEMKKKCLIENTETLFALKIEKYYLDAKYNPRTPIGEKFANKLYDENFNK